jgi:hypothetical protein
MAGIVKDVPEHGDVAMKAPFLQMPMLPIPCVAPRVFISRS